MRRTAATAAGACAAVATLVATTTGLAPATAAPEARTAKTIAWKACSDPDLKKAKAQCGLLEVPLDYADPDGRQIKIAVSRVKSTAPAGKRQGIVLNNPGGPGGSGLWTATLGAGVPDGVGSLYDWVGFDPRGVGASRPALSCDPNFQKGPRPDYVPDAEYFVGPTEQRWIDRAKTYAAKCGKKYPELLEHMRSVDTVRDMDRIRAALGEEKLNYYGYSYGTYLGQVYATMFPDRVRRFVLDGNVKPDGAGYGDGAREQSIAFEGVMKKFWAWVAKYDKVYHLGWDPESVEDAYYEAEDALRVKPVGDVGPAEWNDVFLLAGYAEYLWPRIATAWSEWAKGKHAAITALYTATDTPGDDNGYAAFNATLCSDAYWPRDYGRVKADTYETAQQAPFVAWGSQWFSGPCVWWPAKQGTPVEVEGAHAPGFLLINATLDGATPFADALAVRQEFPRSSLIAEVGWTTHAGSLSGDACVDDRVARYLRTGDLPGRKPGSVADVNCKALPQPVPDELEAKAAEAKAAKDSSDGPAARGGDGGDGGNGGGSVLEYAIGFRARG